MDKKNKYSDDELKEQGDKPKTQIFEVKEELK